MILIDFGDKIIQFFSRLFSAENNVVIALVFLGSLSPQLCNWTPKQQDTVHQTRITVETWCIGHESSNNSPQSVIITSSCGIPDGEPCDSMKSTTSIPSTTFPKTTCLKYKRWACYFQDSIITRKLRVLWCPICQI